MLPRDDAEAPTCVAGGKTPVMAEFHESIRVEFCDTDAAGIVYFANYFRFMERVEHAFFRSLGLSVITRSGNEYLSFPRVRAECEYLAPARFEDQLDLALRVARLGSTSVTFRVEFRRDGATLARGRIVAVCCRVVPGGPMTPVEIPEFIRAPMRAYLDPSGAG